MIEIQGLTPRQLTIADLLWACASIDDLSDLIHSLPTHKDQVDATSLVKLMAWDTAEQELGLYEYEHQAVDLIDRCR